MMMEILDKTTAHECQCDKDGKHAHTEDKNITTDKTTVVFNQDINGEYRHLMAICSDASAAAVPGQFFQLLCPDVDGAQPFFRRPMSLYGVDPLARTVEFLYKVAGKGTKGLATLRTGDCLDIMGPLGHGFELKECMSNIVAVGRGAGLATLGPLAKAAKDRAIKVTAILSARDQSSLLSVELFRKYGADVITVLDSDGSSAVENIEAILKNLIEADKCDTFFTCGSKRLLKLQQELAFEYGIEGQAALEEQMACGIGLCHCCIKHLRINGEVVAKQVCSDGPVFNLKEVIL